MDPLKRELRLHKVVAVSGFLFALCVLPIAQKLIVDGEASADKGAVAGVSTDSSVTTAASVLTPEQCVAQQQKDLADLQLFYDGKKQALLSEYEAAVKPYKEAQLVLTGTPEQVGSEKAALDKLIDAEYQPYLAQLKKVDDAVAPARAEIEARSC